MELKDKEGISVHNYLFLLYLAQVGHIIQCCIEVKSFVVCRRFVLVP